MKPSEEHQFPTPEYPVDTQLNQPSSKSKKARKKQFRGLFSIVQLVFAIVFIALIIQNFVFKSFQVIGQSMEPTLSQGDYLIISRVGKTWGDIFSDGYVPARRDIIVITSPRDDKKLIKRVIGLPGDRVFIQNGVVTIYNKNNPQGFTPDAGLDLGYTDGFVDVTVPDKELFVIGDNRGVGGSLDSRSLEIGTIKTSEVVGKLSIRLYPFDEISTF